MKQQTLPSQFSWTVQTIRWDWDRPVFHIPGGLGGGGGGAAAIQGRGPIGGVDPHSQIVRLRGLPYSANDGDIRAFFKDIHVRAVHFIKDQTGRFSF